jgi:hypothetical protein
VERGPRDRGRPYRPPGDRQPALDWSSPDCGASDASSCLRGGVGHAHRGGRAEGSSAAKGVPGPARYGTGCMLCSCELYPARWCVVGSGRAAAAMHAPCRRGLVRCTVSMARFGAPHAHARR